MAETSVVKQIKHEKVSDDEGGEGTNSKIKQIKHEKVSDEESGKGTDSKIKQIKHEKDSGEESGKETDFKIKQIKHEKVSVEESGKGTDSKIEQIKHEKVSDAESGKGTDSKIKHEKVSDEERGKGTESKINQIKHEKVTGEGSGKGTDSKIDLKLTLEKLSLGPKKKLIVLCLGGLLVDRVHVRNQYTVRGLRPDLNYGKFLVFTRPFCTEFLDFCFERFEVALWSSAREHNIDSVLSSITGGKRSKIRFVWGQERSTDSGFGCVHKKEKPLFLKQLKNLWANPSFKGEFSASNTLLIDDEPHTCLLNPPNTAIFPHPYKRNSHPNDAYLGPGGELRKFLNGLVDAEDVPCYVKDHRIGQAAITPSHPNWDYYSKVVNRFV